MIKWFHKLKVGQKLALISFLFMIPDSVMLYLFITSINENIQVAKLEQVGNKYQRPLERLLDLVPRHRLLARQPGTDALQAMHVTQDAIDAAFDALEGEQARDGQALEFTDEGLAKRNRQGCDPAGVRREWDALKAALITDELAARDAAHVKLIADLRTMIAHSGDVSNLILDPELDSYYLMDATLMALPQTQDRLVQVMVDAEDFSALRGDDVAAGKTKLAIDLTLLKVDDLDRITSSLQTALSTSNPSFGTNASFHTRVPALAKEYADAATHFQDLVTKLKDEGPSKAGAAELAVAGGAARAASFRLWDACVDELDGMLQNRVDYYRYRRTRSLGVAASALLAAILFVTFITRSISGPLKRQAAELKVTNAALTRARALLEKRVETSQVALARTEEKYRAIFENAVMGIFQTTTEGRFLSANAALAHLMGYASAEALIASVGDVGRQVYADPGRRRQFLELVARNGAVSDFQSEIVRKDGAVRWIAESAREVRDAGGKLLYYEGTVEDVTQRKRAEFEERRAQESAQAARAAAEAASTAKSDFLATMSHEIRTPLNGVIGMVDLLGHTPLNAQQARYLKIIQSSSDGLLSLINQILDFSKIEAGKLELSARDFDLHYAVEEVVVILAQKAAAKGLELACQVDPSVPRLLRGDDDRLRQVLMNVVNNGIKFTARGEVVVRVSGDDSPSTPGVRNVRFTVTDTGAGIPPDRMDRLFKSFSQVDTSITRKYGGTGLGLAISKQLVELMGGSIGVSSKVGEGSTFWFTVALNDVDAAAVTPKPSLVGPGGRRVLVVDDSATQCQLLREQLMAWGTETFATTSPAEAVGALKEASASGRAFDLAIIDLNMPETNGMELARRVRAEPSLRELPMILMSGIDAAVDAEAGGFACFLTKPIRQSQLFDGVMKSLAVARPVVAPAVAVAETPAERVVDPKGVKILLAEDMEVNQFVVTETLARDGYVCDIACNGREAVEAVRAKAYDVVLMDCQMPEMSGFEAAAAIREMERGSAVRVPIIALTANAVVGDRERCLEAGMDEYLTKPLNPAKLMAAIERFAARRNPETVLAATPAWADEVVASDAVDYPELLARCGGDAGMVRRLAAKFQQRGRQVMKQVLDGVAAKDAVATARHAHALKGTAANLSARKVAELAEQLEDLGHASDLSTAEQVAAELARELEKCLDVLGSLAGGEVAAGALAS